MQKVGKSWNESFSTPEGVEPYEEKNRRYLTSSADLVNCPCKKEGEEVDYRGVLHRDGSVLMSVSLDQLKEARAPTISLLLPNSLLACH